MTSRFLPTKDGDEYVRTTVIPEDGHPKLDPHLLNRFAVIMSDLCSERGLDQPTIAYANRSEILA